MNDYFPYRKIKNEVKTANLRKAFGTFTLSDQTSFFPVWICVISCSNYQHRQQPVTPPQGTVDGDLTMTSTQDTSRHTAKQTSASAGISVPLGAGAMSVSGSFSNDNTKANTETVNQVSGVFAGTGGYNLNVTGQTALTGAVIASTAASAKNSLTTGSLITEDLHNSSDYKASSMGLSASWSGHNSTKDGQAADKDGKAVTDGSAGYQSGYNGYNAGLPSVMNAKGSTDSTTHAGVSAGAVTITNEAAQQTATGQTAAQTIAGMNRDVSADPLNSTGVANLYEQNKDNIANGFAIVKTLGQNTNTFMAEMAKDLDKKGSEPAIGEDGKAIMVDVKDNNGNITQQPATIAQAVTAGLKPVGDTATSYISQNKAFGTGGYGSIMLTAIVGAASGNVTGSGSALLQNTAINVLRQYGAQKIKTIADGFRPAGATTDDALSGSIRAALHAIAGCAGAAATGGDCTSAAAGSAATVALNNLIGADTTKMNAEQKQAYSNLMGTLVAGVTAGAGGDAAAAQLASAIEVNNNEMLTTRNGTQVSSNNKSSPDLKRIEDIAAAIGRGKRKEIPDVVINAVRDQAATDSGGTIIPTNDEVTGAIASNEQTGTEVVNCRLNDCSTGGAVSAGGVILDLMGVGAGVRAVAAEAAVMRAEVAVAKAETAVIRAENNFYADDLQPADWTNGKSGTSNSNLATHWEKHSAEFPELQSANDYYRATLNFTNDPPVNTLTKTASNGDRLFYNPSTNTFAVTTKEGLPRTMFKPSPSEHGFSTNLEFWNSK